MDLRKFDGEVSLWFIFWDVFEFFIYKNFLLVFVDKFNYLNLFFMKLVFDIIFGLFFIVLNYEEVIVIFRKRFGNK